jgi:hypothetical protein
MTSFSFGVQSTCVVVLVALLIYTLALMRSDRLSAHVTVRWVLAEIAAIGAVLLWGRLPVIAYTSSLGDRELLVILAVLFFALIAFLMLDSLQRISTQAAQIRRLTQELALFAASQPADRRIDRVTAVPDRSADAPIRLESESRSPAGVFAQVLLTLWLIACLGLYVMQGVGLLPEPMLRLLSAGYRQ